MQADLYRQCLEAARRLLAQGQIDQARLSLEQAHRLAPKRPEALDALAGLAMQTRQFRAAAGYFSALLGLVAAVKGRSQIQVQLGCALQMDGQHEAAAAAFAAALELDPERGDAAQNLGALLIHLGLYQEAEVILQRAARARPPLAESLGLLAFLALRRGESTQAEAWARQALALRADAHEARYQLASALREQDRRPEAEREYLTLIETGFRRADCLLALADSALKRTDLQQARHWLQQVLALRPDAAAWQLWTHMLLVSGDTAHANREYDRLLAQSQGPELLRLAAARIQSRYCDPAVSAQALRADHRDFARRCEGLKAALPARPLQYSAGRPVRIGFFQPDCYTHPASYLLRMLLEFAPTGLETHVFTLPGKQDALTARMQALAGHWHWLDKREQALAANAGQIAAAQLDLLVDFAGFSSWSPLPLLARQPVPRILTGLGLPIPTGLPFVSACSTDSWCEAAPPGWREIAPGQDAYEPALVLPSWICWEAPADTPPLRTTADRPFSFGSPHNLAKLNPELLASWAEVLAACPGSRLCLKAPFVHEASVRQRLLAPFAALGLADRVDLEPSAGYADYLDFYHRIDCVLDSSPYPGGTTSCEALWMGVPVLVRPARHAGGLSLVSQAGHPEWACATGQDLLQQARKLAEAGPRSLAARLALRERVSLAPAFRPRFWAEGVASALTEWIQS